MPPHAQVKESLLKSGLVDDNMYCHILSGLGAGFFAVICGSPVDVVKSRLMGALPAQLLDVGSFGVFWEGGSASECGSFGERHGLDEAGSFSSGNNGSESPW